MNKIVTNSTKETRDLGKNFAKNFQGGEVICLEGDLGTGKTTFSQGLLEGLGAKGPYTSPTFLVMKNYQVNKVQIRNIYHIDTYRVDMESILDLGWEEFTSDNNNVVIIEWPNKLKKILPSKRIEISFELIDEEKRSIVFNKCK
jgi:tRNA threonylcarbamoyladenosine biosynthesis protein TsaE